MLMYDINHLNKLLAAKLHLIRQIPFDVIVHLPRSGTIPASILSTYLVKPLASVDEYCNGLINTRKSYFKTLHRILLVDDSIRTGRQMLDAVTKIKNAKPDTEIYCLAVYSTIFKERVLEATLVLQEHEDCEYIYPWFMWKTKKIGKVAVDMDGVLCRDCTSAEDDDGILYAEFLRTAELKFKSEFQIGWIVTSRLEKYRKETEKWLKKHGVEYKHLIMGKWANRQTRKEAGAAYWKAEIYKKLPCTLYIESSEREAVIIAKESGKRVWCIDGQRIVD